MDIIIDYLDEETERQASTIVATLFGVRNALLTDGSTLSDFFPNGLSLQQIDSAPTYDALKKVWREQTLSRVKQHWGIDISTTHYPLVSLCSLIQEQQKAKNLH